MASKLDAALAWAARGFRVFPLQENTKLPLDQGWTISATTDLDVIRAVWTDPVVGAERDYNIGVLTSDLIAADVDTKAGKPGLATMLRLGLEFDTLTVRTPTGGWHLYYKSIGREVGNAPLGPGLDVRSHHGYLLAPGSTIDGVPYTVEIDEPVADFPVELRPLLKAPRSRRDASGVSVELDLPEALELAAHWLRREAPIAIQGENGDDATYRVACRVRDFGVSEGAALDLLLDEWNDRCEPPWSVHEVRLKVENAYRYATGEAGSASPAALFDGVVHVPPPGASGRDTIAVPFDGSGLVRFGNMMREADIPARPWIIEGLLMEQAVTLLLAPGGAGKSLLSLIIAAHLAVGEPLWGHPITRPGKSIIYNAEDDLAEVSRRLVAICRLYSLDVDAVSSQVCLLGRRDIKLKFTKGQPPTINEDHVAVFRAAATDPGVVMFSVDPLIGVHTAKENDSIEMEYVMDVIRDIAWQAGIAEIVVQHTAKMPSDALSGNQDAGRGSTAIAAAARVALTLTPASDKDCVLIGASIADRKSFVKLEGAKANYSAKAGETWLRWRSDQLVSGDKVGVLVEHDAEKARLAEATRLADAIGSLLLVGGCAAVSLRDMVDRLAAAQMTDRNEPNAMLEKRLRVVFNGPVFPTTGAPVVLKLAAEGLSGPHFLFG